MVKETYTMEIEIEYEFDDTQTTPVDAQDAIDYFADVKVTLDDENINILNARLITKINE